MDNNLIFGLHSVKAAVEFHPTDVLSAWVEKGNESKTGEVVEVLEQIGTKIQYVPKKTLDAMVDGSNHQGVVIKIREQPAKGDNELYDLVDKTDRCFLLILDNVTDPQNLGACFRNADAAGVTAIVVPKDKSVGITGTVRKVASGAVEQVPFFQVTNLARTLKALQEKGIWIVGTAGEAEKLVYDTDLTGNIALVMGSEGTGMRRLTRENCDELVKLPMNGSVSSLNVSVASGIFLYEVVRQRLAK